MCVSLEDFNDPLSVKRWKKNTHKNGVNVNCGTTDSEWIINTRCFRIRDKCHFRNTIIIRSTNFISDWAHIYRMKCLFFYGLEYEKKQRKKPKNLNHWFEMTRQCDKKAAKRKRNSLSQFCWMNGPFLQHQIKEILHKTWNKTKKKKTG